MPKIRSSFSNKIREWISTANTDTKVFTTDGKIVFCNPCGKSIVCERKSQVDQHIKTVIVIKKLETQNMTLQYESISIINKTKEKINSIPGSKGATLATKLNELYNKNEGLKILRKINSVLLGENVQLEDLYEDPTILSCFKYAPITSVDVERLFSVFKNMLTDKRYSFTEEKLEMHMIIHFIRFVAN
ncbi:uncharacterized protein LOC132938173 [Metopolophium dirhodum]|uniref:uncharacterized protein LOC132938173 n=1 Tax=Metopolophium dirhodum TaxID=44670 RepID=UPI00298FF605|nr:uncharacterized protein LOC132938173 [Metopolophium dirhodum]